MKTLVIHPDDRSTDFLRPIYKRILNKTVVTTKSEVVSSISDMINNHNRVIMLGHGSSQGLFGINFETNFVIGSEHVSDLRKKTNNVYIWCNADNFVNKWELKGLYSGMFISEVSEALFCGVQPASQSDVNESNNRFANILGECIEGNQLFAFSALKQEYSKLADLNSIAKYNCDRLYCVA